jgi:nucleoside 2-deoxyribosyltransferase
MSGDDMRIYLAGSFDLIPEVEAVCDSLERAGHTILVKWWGKDGFDMRDKKMDQTSDSFYKDPVCKQIFERDLAGVLEADVLVIVAGATPKKFNGAIAGYGIAVAHGKPCFSIGRLENSAMYYPIRQCDSLKELMSMLDAANRS